MAKTPKLVRGKKLLPTTATSAGKHDVIVEMTDTAPMTRREGRDERKMDLRIHLSEKRRKGREGRDRELELCAQLPSFAQIFGWDCHSSRKSMWEFCCKWKAVAGTGGFMSNCQAK